MAISRVGWTSGTTSGNLASLSAGSIQADDIVVGYGFRDGNNTAPTIPGTFTPIDTTAGSASNGQAVGWMKIVTGSETTGTWTSATSVVFHVYRGVNTTTPIGDHVVNGSTGTTVVYQELTGMSVTDGTSWVVGFAGHRSTNTSLENAPTGMSNWSTAADATDEAAGHDTNGGVSSWLEQSVSVGGTSSGWRTAVIELIAASSGATATPGTLTGSGTVPAPTVSGAASVSPSTLTAPPTIPAVTVSGAVIVSPAALAGTPSIPVIALTTDQVLTPAALAGSATVPIAAASVNTSASPSALSTTPATPAVAVTGAAGVAAASVHVLPSIPAAAVSGTALMTPSALTTTAAVPAPSVDTGGGTGSEVTPSAVAGSATMPPPTVSAAANVLPSALSTSGTATAGTVGGAASVLPPALSTASTAAAPTVVGAAVVSPDPLAGLPAFLAASVAAASRASPGSLSASALIPSVSAAGGANVQPGSLAALAAVLPSALMTEIYLLVDSLVASAGIPTPAIDVQVSAPVSRVTSRTRARDFELTPDQRAYSPHAGEREFVSPTGPRGYASGTKVRQFAIKSKN